MPATKQPYLRPRPSAVFADFIINARRACDLSQQQLAAAVGADRSTIVRWESGDGRSPHLPVLRGACTVLGVRYVDALLALGALTVDDLAEAA